MAITTQQLSDLIEKAFNDESDVRVDPVQARKRQAQRIANAIEQYVVGRNTMVTGTSATGGAVTGTGIIQ
ncbi:hypothetical protein [Aquimarina latercula]|uniref:hypothetical protein n=1 Tax=Aquimarina latercula TaxID=987 RepID=UPI00040A5091|nr:hypothetical protein [Aquimarina latercula]